MFRFITTSAAAEDPGSVCQVSADLGEFGVYDLELSDGSCTLTEKLAPVSANLALLVVFLVFALRVSSGGLSSGGRLFI